jgi:hypothetical protein
MKNITAIEITATECAPETDTMVCRKFSTASGFAAAFAAVACDASDYPPGGACNKLHARVHHEGGVTAIEIEVRGGDVSPFGMELWA